MLIGEICAQARVTKETIRHYESLGLIYSTPRPAGSRVYRDYDEETLKRLDFITKGKALGFKLREMQPLLDLRISNALSPKRKIQILEDKLNQVEATIQASTDIKQYLEAAIEKLKLQQIAV